jgi:hypothetical protein
MKTETVQEYISNNGVATLVKTEQVEIDVDAQIASKEEELLKVYAELEEMKAAAQE